MPYDEFGYYEPDEDLVDELEHDNEYDNTLDEYEDEREEDFYDFPEDDGDGLFDPMEAEK